MRNVLVTGGSRGLGLAIVTRLAASGFRVIAVARGESVDLTAAVQRANATSPGSLHFRPFDLADLDAIPGFVATMSAEFGQMYGLVNNAGLGTGGVLATMPDTQIERLLRLNVSSPIALTKYVVRTMMNGGGGRIVNITSIVATNGFNGLSVYSASKAALEGFGRALAREVGRLDITVNCVAPGFINTDMTQSMTPEQKARIAQRSALRRLAEPDDVAGAVAYLLSDAARTVTGTTLTVDAGNTA